MKEKINVEILKTKGYDDIFVKINGHTMNLKTAIEVYIEDAQEIFLELDKYFMKFYGEERIQILKEIDKEAALLFPGIEKNFASLKRLDNPTATQKELEKSESFSEAYAKYSGIKGLMDIFIMRLSANHRYLSSFITDQQSNFIDKGIYKEDKDLINKINTAIADFFDQNGLYIVDSPKKKSLQAFIVLEAMAKKIKYSDLAVANRGKTTYTKNELYKYYIDKTKKYYYDIESINKIVRVKEKSVEGAKEKNKLKKWKFKHIKSTEEFYTYAMNNYFNKIKKNSSEDIRMLYNAIVKNEGGSDDFTYAYSEILKRLNIDSHIIRFAPPKDFNSENSMCINMIDFYTGNKKDKILVSPLSAAFAYQESSFTKLNGVGYGRESIINKNNTIFGYIAGAHKYNGMLTDSSTDLSSIDRLRKKGLQEKEIKEYYNKSMEFKNDSIKKLADMDKDIKILDRLENDE